MDICIYKCASKVRLAKHSAFTVLKQHAKCSDVIYRQGKSITVSSITNSVMTEIDGDLSIRDAGSITIDMAHSDFSLRGSKGDLLVKSADGDISIREVEGKVNL